MRSSFSLSLVTTFLFSLAGAGCSTGGTGADTSGGLGGISTPAPDAATAVASGGMPPAGGTSTGGVPVGTGGLISTGGVAAGGTVRTGGTARTGGTVRTGGIARTGGTATGGIASTGGVPGTGGTATGGNSGPPKILWSCDFSNTTKPWGLDDGGVEYPIGTKVTPADENGANLSVVPDPLGGAGNALRHFAKIDGGGARSQGGIFGDRNVAFGEQVKKPEGVWVAQEWYFPEVITAGGEAYCWINLWDFHSLTTSRGARWDTTPGLMLARDGSMKVRWEWGASRNPISSYSTIAMPVGRWFDIEMHYVWTDTATATLSLWIDGQLALEQSGVKTKDPSHGMVETYFKFYGSTQNRGAWTPTPSLKYTRNIRVAGERIWRQP